MAESTTNYDMECSVEEPKQSSQLVIETVADAEGVDPIALQPLYSTIDPDALDALFQPQLRPASDPSVGEVQFSYHGYTVRVTAAGRVNLTEE